MRVFEITVELADHVTEIGVIDVTKHKASADYIKDNHPDLYATLKEKFNYDIVVYQLEE